MAMPASTANWHWKTKHVGPWAKTWFERELPTLKVTGADGKSYATISSVEDFDGDVEIGQRKSKLLTIYDVKIELKWSGETVDGTAVSGKLTIPEVSHENTLDGVSDYEFQWTCKTASSANVDLVYQLAKTQLRAALEAKFKEFPSAILNEHSSSVTVNATPDDSRTGTPAPGANSTATTAANATKTAVTSSAPKASKPSTALNTSTVKVESRFMASADDLFSILTDEKRIPQWSRAPAQSNPKVGSTYSLFGGGVTGSFTVVEPPTKFEQSWVLKSPSWPSAHSATLITELDQQTDSTQLTLTLKGVPKGMEEEIERNLEGYYIRGLKSIGYVQVENYHPSTQWQQQQHRSSNTSKSKRGSHEDTDKNNVAQKAAVGLVFAGLVLAFSILAPLWSSSPASSR